MELKEFVKNVLVDLNLAVDEASNSTNRTIRFSENEKNRTIEFDVAVTAEKKGTTTGKAGVKVLGIAEGGGKLEKESKTSVVSRVKFGVRVDPHTRQESQARKQTKSGNIQSLWAPRAP